MEASALTTGQSGSMCPPGKPHYTNTGSPLTGVDLISSTSSNLLRDTGVFPAGGSCPHDWRSNLATRPPTLLGRCDYWTAIARLAPILTVIHTIVIALAWVWQVAHRKLC